MKFQIDSVQTYNYAWKVGDRFKEILKLYPYLKGKIAKLPNDNRNIITIEINSLEELNDLVNGCMCQVVYDATNYVDEDGLNGKITIYDDYMEQIIMNKNIIAEQVTAVYLKNKLIGMFHFGIEETEKYINDGYVFLGLSYDDVADLEYQTFWDVYYED